MSNEKCWPRISVVTPSYNQGRLLEECIHSVLEQNYPDLEYIIIDGGSTDNSVEIIKKYKQHLAYWVSQPDRSMYHALNKGLRMATGELIGLINADDLYVPGTFQAAACTLVEKPSVEVVCGDAIIFEENNGQKRTLKVLPSAKTERLTFQAIQAGLSINACFISRRSYQKVGGFDERYRVSGDRDLLMRLALQDHSMVHLGRTVYHYRLHETALTNTRSPEAERRRLREDITIGLHWLSQDGLPHDAKQYCQALLARACFSLTAMSVRERQWQDALKWAWQGFRHAPQPMVQLARTWVQQKVQP